jgi:hypothetical protein
MTDQNGDGKPRRANKWEILASLGTAITALLAVLGYFALKPVVEAEPVRETADLQQPAPSNPAPPVVEPAPLEPAPSEPAPSEPTQKSAPDSAPQTVDPEPKPSPPAPTAAPETSPPASVPLPSQPLATDLTVSLVGFAAAPNNYFIATLRFNNSGDTPASIAMVTAGTGRADVFATDLVGGSCQMSRNGENWGTMKHTTVATPKRDDTAMFSSIPTHGSAQHTLIFTRCKPLLTVGSLVSINASFVVARDGQRSLAQVGFADAPIR